MLQPLFCGGTTRAESVLNALLAFELELEDWVLVHDAACPCLSAQQLTHLLDELRNDEVGGLLADTLKRADAITGAVVCVKHPDICSQYDEFRLTVTKSYLTGCIWAGCIWPDNYSFGNGSEF